MELELSENKKCCTDCRTTKTPLWRGGPAGPKVITHHSSSTIPISNFYSFLLLILFGYRKRRASMVGMNKGQEKKRERAQNGTSSSSSSSSGDTVGVGGGRELRESLKVKLMALGEEVLLQRSPSVLKKQRRNMLGEEEQAAVCLMALSCGFVFA
ncbi:GATA transcription factor 15-like isoform X2 [Gastrolobium bilobum]|uniref:GATA transcription factor 15-like isoform X2 n=1 Tax=Gastrolobium bilobum TaxID=150636 RepID=UPI002AB15C05|nr:GATA transcription factor 15-like isoform X2 [Gastrolobium bilobum]